MKSFGREIPAFSLEHAEDLDCRADEVVAFEWPTGYGIILSSPAFTLVQKERFFQKTSKSNKFGRLQYRRNNRKQKLKERRNEH